MITHCISYIVNRNPHCVPVCRARFLPAPAFAAATAALGAYLLWALTSDARSKGLTNPFGSYGDVFFGQRVPQPPQRERDY
jgi:hypothetical protein